MLETLSILVHADSKIGKTTFGATAPAPVLILDAEGSTKFLPVTKIEWDPTQYGPPVYDGTWTHCIVVVRDFETLRMAFQWLVHGQHQFRSVVLDSISEMQRKLKTTIVGTEQMQIAQWGELLTKMDGLIRGYRDLTLHPTNPIQVAVFIAETREVNGKWRPYLQGQISVALPYWVDLVTYLFIAEVPTADGQSTVRQRQLLTVPHPQYEAGERVQGRLPDVIAEPNIEAILSAIFPTPVLNTAPDGVA